MMRVKETPAGAGARRLGPSRLPPAQQGQSGTGPHVLAGGGAGWGQRLCLRLYIWDMGEGATRVCAQAHQDMTQDVQHKEGARESSS